MDINHRLSDLETRGLVDHETIQIVLRIKQRLSDRWRANVTTPLVDMLLFHFACALGRVQRGYTVSPLYQEFMDEIESAVNFSHISIINTDLVQLVPFIIPQDEQTYFLANIYSLLLEQPWIADDL